MGLSIDGATRMHVIVGDPIAQVKSPGGMSAAFAARGQNAMCVPIHVTPERLPIVLAAADVTLNLDSIIVTVPHKFACYRHCRTASDRSHFLGASNVMRRNPDGSWHGDMLDGLSFIAAIRAAGCEPEGRRALLVGAGGAGSAMAYALAESGVRELAIHDIDARRRDGLIARLAARTGVRVLAGSTDPSGFDLIANATPLGMRPGDPLPVEVARLTRDMFVGCVITSPEVSPLVEAARAAGCRATVGGDMYRAQQPLMLAFIDGGARLDPPGSAA